MATQTIKESKLQKTCSYKTTDTTIGIKTEIEKKLKPAKVAKAKINT